MTNSFCRHLSNGFRIYIRQGKVSWRPCCYWQGPEIDFENFAQQRNEINVDHPWYHESCSTCQTEESYKTPNGYREIGNRVIPVLPQHKAGWIDIQADITCNGGCLICGPWSSSFWQSELSRYREFEIAPVRHDLHQLVNSIFAQIDTSELRLLQFLGGEPFLSDVDQWAMAHINNPGQCMLKYTTNGSVFPKLDRITSWKKFKEVLINFSIDGVGPQFEYLRYPLQWSRVEDNVKRMIDINADNVAFHINHSVTPLNIYFYQEFLDWVAKTFPPERFRGIHTHPAYGTMSVASTTGKVRQMVVDRYGSDHLLSKMLADNPYCDTGFTEWIEKWDQRRSLNWRSVFKAIA